ncbi:SipW-dependent-type signal peptide-containing protein [Williamsia sterculiae]|uniref:SipW-cognate class signal peptide n=1 Tax=Williamsia sterculiae TaxID=1344003 RepID=A0A1N7HAQ1_9NOCA|nr:SipW-dependent-type signal peptide-containing protein [Williamsia sterculiae]SIS21955.1 SipW-cognate class signal peptide [Williamsia sterculiae]
MTLLNALGVLVSRRVRAVLSIGMVLGIGVVGTLALWSSSVATQSGVFTTATVSILADGSKAAAFTFSPTGLLPGQSAAKVIAVSNSGTAAITYSAAVASSNALGQAMTLTVVPGASATNGVCGSGTKIADGIAVSATATTFSTNRGPLAASGGAENLCVQVNLPLTADASVAGTTGTVVLTFTGSAGT